MAEIRLEKVRKAYDGVVAVHGVDLTIADGEFVVFLGPSGCGKSTTLRMIAGLEEVTSGAIRIGARDVTHLEPKDRNIAMVFQNYALYPHKTIYDNLAFGLRMRKMDRAEIDVRVRKAAHMLGLEDYLARKPKQLSGGQMQRVALGRALVREPDVFLLDEPLSNLDAKLRVRMREEIARLHQEVGTSMVYVTHDQVEAMTLADRIVVLRKGVVEQVGTPLDLYNTLSKEGASEEPPSEGFLLSIEPQYGGSELWMRDDVTGDPERIIRFVQRCAAEFGLTGKWGFQYANTCSKPRLDGFGGGAHVLDLTTGETVDWIYTDGWLAQTVSGEGGPL